MHITQDPTHLTHFLQLQAEAEQAQCRRAKCASSVVDRHNRVLSVGLNRPAGKISYCNTQFDVSRKPKYDTTCCVHAEWNAIFEALKVQPDLRGSTLYFMRINSSGEMTDAGEPYCTACSRLTLASGISQFALYNQGFAHVYTTEEYDQISYDYFR